MPTARLILDYPRFFKLSMMRLACCAVLAAALAASNATEARAAGEGVDPNFVADVRSPTEAFTAVLQPDGKIVIAGSFSSVGGAGHNRVARLNPDGSVDASFLDGNAIGIGFLHHVALQPDGKILIVGSFASASGTQSDSIARLNPDGTLDHSFNPDVHGRVGSTAVQPDGKILIGSSVWRRTGALT